MIIRKRYQRDLKHNLSLYISTTLLTVLALLLFYLYYIAGTGILDFTEGFFASQKVEDANFTTLEEIPDEELKKIEDRYSCELEKQHYINIETDGVISRIFERSKQVDLYQVTAGKDVKKDTDVVISEGYAANQGISIGDSIKIGEKDYTITGFAERPDYLYMLPDLSDADKNVTSFYLAYMTDAEFKTLDAKNCQYLVRYKGTDPEEFRKSIHEQYKMRSYVAAEENVRITMMTEQPELFLQMAYLILLVLPVLVVVLISIILSRKIRSEQKMIGTLAAYGYTGRQLILHYAGFAAVPGIVGGILTTIGTAIFAEPYGALGLMDYEPIKADFRLGIFPMLLGILVPTFLYTISTAYTVNRLLKHEISTLLAGEVKGKNKVRKSLLGKNVSFRIKFGVREILGNPGRTFALFLGVFAGMFIIVLSLGSLDSVKHAVTEIKGSMSRYEYQYTLNVLKDRKDAPGETLLAGSVEDKDGMVLSLIGADDNQLIGLKDPEGREVEITDGYYITSLYSKLTGIRTGDKLCLLDPLSLKEYEVRVKGILQNDFMKGIYTTRKSVSEITGIEESLYNVILSKEKLDLPDQEILHLTGRDTLEKQYDTAFDQIDIVLDLMAGMGIVLCIAAIYLVVNMVIQENRSNISMLRVLGYEDRKINRLLLNDNLVIVLLAAAAAVPASMFAIKAMFASFVDILGYLVEAYVRPSTYLTAFFLVLLSYFVSFLFLRRKVAKVDMVESLKDNRE